MKKLLITLCISFIVIQFSFSQNSIQFIITDLPELEGKKVGIRGSVSPLSWEKSIPLLKGKEGYSVTLEFPVSAEEIEFKFVLFDDDSNPVWENTSNRSERLTSDGEVISLHSWNVEQVIDINSLPLLQPDELMKDFELIKTMVLEVHPGTYRYNDEASIQEEIMLLEEKFQQPITHGEAYLAMSKLTAAIQCDHTKVGFNNQNKVINSVIHGQPDKLPFTFRWFGERMLVEYDATLGNIVGEGTEVLSINGVSVADIQRKMFPYIAADGSTDQNRIYKMQVEGFDFRYNAFDVFYPLLFPFKNKNLELEIIKAGTSQKEQVIVIALTREERAKNLERKYPEFPKSRDDMWSFELLENHTALLTINSFGAFGWKAMSMDWKAFLEEKFSVFEEKGIEHLIIDIRRNNGGADEMAKELFSYLDIKKDITLKPFREGRTRYLKFPETLKPFVQSWGENPWYFDLETKEQNDIYYVFPDDMSEDRFLKRDKNMFNGEVYLLTSSANTSLAFYTALNFRRQQLGMIIGQETGGNMRDINGGQILFLRLPNSGIEIDFPVMGGFAFGDQPNNGVKPDVETSETIEAFINGSDIEMEKALNMISKN